MNSLLLYYWFQTNWGRLIYKLRQIDSGVRYSMDMSCHDFPWVVMSCHDFPWLFMNFHAFPLSMTFYDFPWVVMSFHELSWLSMSCHDFPWVVMTFHELPWVVLSCHELSWLSMTFHELSWVVMSFHELPWVGFFFWKSYILDIPRPRVWAHLRLYKRHAFFVSRTIKYFMNQTKANSTYYILMHSHYYAYFIAYLRFAEGLFHPGNRLPYSTPGSKATSLLE
jgi:hypothetical protein